MVFLIGQRVLVQETLRLKNKLKEKDFSHEEFIQVKSTQGDSK